MPRKSLGKRVTIVNTHIDKNDVFLEKLENILKSFGSDTKIINAFDNENPLEYPSDYVILSGVPSEAEYSLAYKEIRKGIDEHFYWLKEIKCPMLGICYGAQIILHIYGGKISNLKKARRNPNDFLEVQQQIDIFEDINLLNIFISHGQYVSRLPQGFLPVSIKNGVPYIVYNPKRKIYGFQFHPEFSGKIGSELLRRFISTSSNLRIGG